MRKVCFLGLMLLLVPLFCYSQTRYYIAPGIQRLFLGFNVLYDYEKLSAKDDFNIESNNMLFEIALGYDFDRVVPRVSFDMGMPLYGVVGFTGGNEYINEIMDARNIKLGLEVGIKPVKIQNVSIIIPLGVLFCWTTYEQKNPSYAEGHPYDRVWDYNYIHLFSGINAVFQLNKHFRIGLFSRIGFPVKKEAEYRATLRGNYVWKATGSSTYSEKEDVDVFTCSIGIGVSANL